MATSKVTLRFTDMTLGQRVYCKGEQCRNMCLFDVRVFIDNTFAYDAWFCMRVKHVKHCDVLMRCFNNLIDVNEKLAKFGDVELKRGKRTVEPRDNPTVRFWRPRAYPGPESKTMVLPRFLFCIEVATCEGDIYNGFVQMPFDNYDDVLTLKGYFEELEKDTPTKARNIKTLNYQERLCQPGI